ncbi:DNA polymerase [uncultured Clostridium sp.]|uniref:DNA polymerase n=1 Tax=uncultured Clostridium sp. TaxID=59620 RepID=UPI00350E355F
MHASLNQDGTETGRFSSSKPNLQQIPARNPIGKKIRQTFRASDGYVMMSSDFSRLAA